MDSFKRPYLSPSCYRLLSYTLDDLGFNSLQDQQIFLFSQNVQTDFVSHPASCSMNTWALSSGIKWPERETDYSFPPSAEVKNDLYLWFPFMTLWRAQGQLQLCVTRQYFHIVRRILKMCRSISNSDAVLPYFGNSNVMFFIHDLSSRFCCCSFVKALIYFHNIHTFYIRSFSK